MTSIAILGSAEGAVFRVKVVPCSRKTHIAGQFDGMLKIKVSAPRDKGKANKCLTEFLAAKLSVRKKDVRIVSGMTSPVKKIEISGLTAVQVTAMLCESKDNKQND
jgi:hypothetical protein